MNNIIYLKIENDSIIKEITFSEFSEYDNGIYDIERDHSLFFIKYHYDYNTHYDLFENRTISLKINLDRNSNFTSIYNRYNINVDIKSFLRNLKLNQLLNE